MPSFGGLTQDRSASHYIGPEELRFVASFMAWFVHEDNDLARMAGWADLWKASVFFAHAPARRTRAGPPPDIAWRRLVNIAAFAAENGDVRLPSQILGCVLYWELRDSEVGQANGSPTLRPPMAASRIKATLSAISLRCLLSLPAAEGILFRHGAVWTTSGLAMFAARVIDTLAAECRLLTRELAALAGDTLEGHGGHARWR